LYCERWEKTGEAENKEIMQRDTFCLGQVPSIVYFFSTQREEKTLPLSKTFQREK
jgi:hypothetical protein